MEVLSDVQRKKNSIFRSVPPIDPRSLSGRSRVAPWSCADATMVVTASHSRDDLLLGRRSAGPVRDAACITGETITAREPEEDTAALFRMGPSSSEVIELPGYDCHPMPALGLKYLNPMRTGPSVVAIGKDGVVWGPSCVVEYGLAGS